MRLLDTYTGRFVEKDPRRQRVVYAILSHTWDADGEQTYQELKEIQKRYANESLKEGTPSRRLSAIWTDPDLSPKILNACVVARKGGHRYIWIDSCCIDKTSSSELSEAINSMYAWYKGAHICYAYLADVSRAADENPRDHDSSFRDSRWFTRGWTLQELIAPEKVVFLAKDWTPLGSKKELAELVSAITDIAIDVLRKPDSLHGFSVSQRLSWAAGRMTTRVEDRAYSLLGIFDINMPTLYGEGERAFQRLQEEILRSIPDQTLFAWQGTEYYRIFGSESGTDRNARLPRLQLAPDSSPPFSAFPLDQGSLFAVSPDRFGAAEQSIEMAPPRQLFYHYPDLPASDYTFTPLGIRTQIPLIPLSAFLPHAATVYGEERSKSPAYLAVLGCEHVDYPGHLLARVCYAPSTPSGARVLSRAFLSIFNPTSPEEDLPSTELVALSPEVLVRSSALSTITTVYLSPPNRSWGGDIIPRSVSEERRPHKTIHLLLKKPEAGASLGARDGSHLPTPPPAGSSGSATPIKTLRWPDRDHPNTHRLTISWPPPEPTAEVQDIIIIEYEHALEDDGNSLTIDNRLTGKLHGHPIIPAETSPWTDQTPWILRERGDAVMVENEKGDMMSVELTLEYLAPNQYLIDAQADWCFWSSDDLRLEEDSNPDSNSDSEEGRSAPEEE